MYRGKKVIIMVMIIGIFLMITGYAVFSSNLKINGTANIETTWEVLFTKIEKINVIGKATELVSSIASGTTATFQVGLTKPGDGIEYRITVSNRGDFDAVIESIEALERGNDVVKFEIKNIKKGDKLLKKSSSTFNVKVYFDESITDHPGQVENNLTIEMKYSQDIGQNVPNEEVNIEGPTITNLSGVNNVNLPNSAGRVLSNYKIYGNMAQRGTPSIDSPSSFTSLGDKGSIKINSYSTDLQPLYSYTINLEGHEPLRSIDNYADYIDFANQRIVRYIVKKELVGTEQWERWNSQNTDNTAGFYWLDSTELGEYKSPTFVGGSGLSSHFKKGDTAHIASDVLRVAFVATSSPPYISFRAPYLSRAPWKNFLAAEKAKGTPVTVYYVLINPVYEEIDLPTIKTVKGESRIEVEGNIENINLEISYYKN